MNPQLHVELWTSWASLLRSYAAAHGLNRAQHAVVEVSAESITVRIGKKWVRFTPERMERSEAAEERFSLLEDGTVLFGEAQPEEMDLAAERMVRELMLQT